MVNGSAYPTDRLECHRWDPLADNTPDSTALARSLGLDPEEGWLILKLRIPFKSKKKNRVRSLALHLDPKPVTVPGPHLTTPLALDCTPLRHPITGEVYTFHVHSSTAEELDPNFLTNPPGFYTRLRYYLTPEVPECDFQIFDSVPCDPPMPPPGATVPYPDPETGEHLSADPHFVEERLSSHIRTAFSARHYKKVGKINWLTRFRCTLATPAMLPVIH
jgi:hypothetical protein